MGEFRVKHLPFSESVFAAVEEAGILGGSDLVRIGRRDPKRAVTTTAASISPDA